MPLPPPFAVRISATFNLVIVFIVSSLCRFLRLVEYLYIWMGVGLQWHGLRLGGVLVVYVASALTIGIRPDGIVSMSDQFLLLWISSGILPILFGFIMIIAMNWGFSVDVSINSLNIVLKI